MQRKRGELVPVAEVIADLPGPVQALRKTSPQARHHFTRFDQVNALVSASEADPQRQVDRLTRYQANLGPPVEAQRVTPLDRRSPVKQCLNETGCPVAPGIKIETELRPREDAAVQTNKRDPLRLPARPAKRFQCFLPLPQVLDHGSSQWSPFSLV